MDPQYVIAMALAIGVVESERQKKRLMEESLWKSQDELLEKERERSVLMRKNQELLAKEAPKKKFVADHLAVFLEGTQSNFGGEEMMNTVATMLKSDADENGGVGGGNGDKDVPRIDLSLEEAVDALVAQANKVIGFGGNNGGFAYDQGNIYNSPKSVQTLGEKAVVTAFEGTKSGGCEGCSAGGYGGSYN